jgi:hypothetical protein
MKIKWTKECLECHSRHDGVCINPRCADFHYDEWGDPIPADVYYMDGNSREEYLAEKRQRMGE